MPLFGFQLFIFCGFSLQLSNYCSFEGVLYCKPHFEQLFKLTRSLDKGFEEDHVNNKLSSLFAGTQDKCVACKKTVYPLEKVAVDGTSYHKACFKCTHGGCLISPSNYVAHEHKLYCKHHHSQLFKEKGNFSQFDKHEDTEAVNENTVLIRCTWDFVFLYLRRIVSAFSIIAIVCENVQTIYRVLPSA
ncbi:hypothetical protein NE237_017448 [Protea cynaroides]|uniref:LIM zinc-binding domain-containing protein n=1 Tax=Protea cynaroides TaxID=273540 RepID=A0A9Q0K816_9MAGN|nr:hypothetical protein NE237_017448 [Protea cynaroides]